MTVAADISIGRDEDGDMNLGIFIDHGNQLSISIRQDGALNWAGQLDSGSQHMFVPPSELGLFLFKLIDKGVEHE